jgi:circadian clock protein KaiB
MMDAPLDTGATGPLILFVAGDSPNSRAAVSNLRRTLATLGGSEDDIEIIDVFERPDIASTARVLVTPALIRRSDPQARILGDLSSTQQLLAFLQ